MDDNLGQNNTPTTPSQAPSGQKSSWGPAVGLVIILLIIIAGSFYFFRGGTGIPSPTETGEEPSVADIEDDLMMLQEQSESSEVEDIEADLEATNVSEMDADLNLAEQEADELGY